MEVFDFIFRIGVILAVYNFLWWLIMILVNLLRGNNKKHLLEIYLIKSVRYLFLADVIFLFVIERGAGRLQFNIFLLSGLILLIYLVGRMQSREEKNKFLSINIQANINFSGTRHTDQLSKQTFDKRLEVILLIVVFGLYSVFYFFPGIAENAISFWFVKTINGIEEAPIFGFIFKVIGFFFLLSVVFKIINGFLTVVSPRRKQHEESGDDDFDRYEEM